MVNILTGIPFNTPKRLNHRDDEGALEFPSSATSRARGLLALKACNWGAAKKKSQLTARDYVQDGLVAMWDGKENAGWDTHEDGTIPVNLVTGSSDLTVHPGNTPSRADYFAFDGSYRLKISPSVTPVTIECCLEYDSSNLETDGTFGVCRVGGQGWKDPKIVLISKDGVCYFPSSYVPYTQNCVIQDGKATLSLVKTKDMYARRFVNGVVSGSDSGVNLGTGWGLDGTVGIGHVISRTLVGVVHSIRAYSRALTDDEVAANYAVDKARFGVS